MIDMRNAKAKLEAALSIEPKTKADQAHRAELMYEANTLAQVLQGESLFRIANKVAPFASRANEPLTREERERRLEEERSGPEAIERAVAA